MGDARDVELTDSPFFRFQRHHQILLLGPRRKDESDTNHGN